MTLIWRNIKTWQDHLTLQIDINPLHEWSVANKMIFHPKKCKVLAVTVEQTLHCDSEWNLFPFQAFYYQLNDTELEIVKSETDLGVTLTSTLKGGLSLLVPHRRYLAVFGGIWRYLAVFGGIWRYLAVFGGIWRYLAVFGGIWRYLAVFGGIWRYLAVFGGIWRYLAVFGGIWRYLAVFGGIWRYLVFVCFMRHVSRVVVYGRRYISA